MEFLSSIGSFIITPLYYLISVGAGGLAPGLRRDLRARERGVLGALHHLPDPGDPGRADPALREADQVQPQHAAGAAQGEGAAEEVRARPRAARRGDDGALQGDRHQPVRLVPAADHPDADLHRAVPADQPRRQGSAARRPHRDRRRPPLQRGDLRRPDLRHVHRGHQHQRADPGRRAGGGDDAHHVPHPAPADEQEHARRRALGALRQPAEDAALHPARGLRRGRYRVPDRCPPRTGRPPTCGR